MPLSSYRTADRRQSSLRPIGPGPQPDDDQAIDPRQVAASLRADAEQAAAAGDPFRAERLRRQALRLDSLCGTGGVL